MPGFEPPDWADIFTPDAPLLGAFVRGTLVYFGVLALFRVILKRQSGGIGLSDVLLAVLVSEAVSQSLNGNNTSLPNGLVTVATLLFWTFAVDTAAYRWGWVRRLIEPPETPLVRDGRLLHDNLRRERVSREELDAQLRLNGIDDPARVRLACMEADGAVSVIPKEAGPPPELVRAVQELKAASARLAALLDRFPPEWNSQ